MAATPTAAMARVMNFIGAGCVKRPRRNEELRKGELGRGGLQRET